MKLCQIWTCCSWYKYKSKKKSWWQKTKKIILPSAKVWHSAKWIFCRVLALGTRQSQYFAECQTEGTRQRGRRWVPLSPGASLPSAQLYRVSGTGQSLALPSALFCRVPDTRQSPICRVPSFAECGTRQRWPLPSARYLALGKDLSIGQSPGFL